jgi:hypothetical protein
LLCSGYWVTLGPKVATQIMKTRVTPDTKARVLEITQAELLTEPVWLRRLVAGRFTSKDWPRPPQRLLNGTADRRREFARHLRDQGIAANATERAVRGETRARPPDPIYRANLRGDSTHTRARIEAVARAGFGFSDKGISGFCAGHECERRSEVHEEAKT